MKRLIVILLLFVGFQSLAQRRMVIGYSESSVGYHRLSHPTKDGLPIFNKFVKENIYDSGIETHSTQSKLAAINRSTKPGDQILSEFSGYIEENNILTPVLAQTIIGLDGLSYTLYINSNGESIHHILHNTYANDTIVGNVFMPDPITSSGADYGGFYNDSDDITNSALDAELKEVFIKATYSDGTYKLANEHLIILNHSAPNIAPTEQSDSIFKFNRGDYGFEEVNALYHITNFAEYIKDTLRFGSLMNYQIHVDVYALNNADNSEFVGSTTVPRLNFGEGGVDDAEDADILIHEYAHAVSHSAAPGSLIGFDRLAMDEGFGDYWAAVYSKRINPNDYKKIFNWDGHNEFWEGRTIDHDRKYSDGLTGNKYVDGELFAATLMDLRNEINDTIVDRLILQSAYGWYPEMTMDNAMHQILKADTLLNENSNSPLLIWIMCQRGFLGRHCVNSTEEFSFVPKVDYTLLNEGILKFKNLYQLETVKIFSYNGQLILEEKILDNSINLNKLAKGVYIVQIGSTSLKVKL